MILDRTLLTLLCDEAGLERLRGSTLIEQRATNRGARRKFERVFYDTPDRRLTHRHLTLCVCKQGRSYRQILEAGADGAPGAAGRGVWEATIPSAEPDIKAIPSLDARERVGLVLPGELEPIFASRGSRHLRTLTLDHPEGATLRAVLVRGEVTVGDVTTPLAAVELEPCAAAPAAHFEIALELHALAPLRWQTRSEAARCLTELTGELPPWRKAKQPELEPTTSVDEALAAIVRACLWHWLQNEEAAADGRDPEGVHQLRVAVRRLSSALSVFAEAIPQEQRENLMAETKWLLNSLGPARDLDVFVTELLAPVLKARPDDDNLTLLHQIAEEQRQLANQNARDAIASPRYTTLLLRFAAWTAAHGWREGPCATVTVQPMVELSDRLLHKRQRKAKKRGRGFADLPVEQRHRVRIALKRVRYASEFFHTLYSREKVRPYLASLKQLQDNLGHLNDVAVAEQRLAELLTTASSAEQERALRAAAGLVIGWHSHGLAVLEPDLVAAWHGFAQQPGFAG